MTVELRRTPTKTRTAQSTGIGSSAVGTSSVTTRAVLFMIACCMLAPSQTQAASTIDFSRDIEPIFTAHCIKCHGPDKQSGDLRLDNANAIGGGSSGNAIVANQSDKSLLIQMVTGTVPDDPDAVMPRDAPRLSKKQITLLKQWIDQGATWPKTEIKGSSHWSLQLLKRPTVPNASFEGWGHNDIDHFIGKKLASAGLRPTDEATRRDLIRRLSFNLTGLPPSPEEIDEFVNSQDPKAYEHLVDRLLASPHYGERWARHWLDVVRFGESHGFEYNQPRGNSWHYRDWVINALNEDMPYDQFVRMQLAGDLLMPGEPSMIKATGFLVAGPHNTTRPSSKKMQMSMQQDEYEDLVGVIGQTFLGLTINCARCHSHKFDPITQREYYEFVAAVAGITPGDRDIPIKVRLEDEIRANELERKRRVLVNELNRIDKTAREIVLDEIRNGTTPKLQPPQAIGAWEFDGDLRDSIGSAHGEAMSGARIDNGALVVDGKSWVKTAPLPFTLKEKTLEAWVQVATLDQSGGGVIGVQTLNGGVFDSIVYAEREGRRWMAGSNGFSRYDSFKAPEERDAAKQSTHVAIVYKADGTIIGYRNGKPYGRAVRKSDLQPFQANEAAVIFGIRHQPPGGNRMFKGRILRAKLYNRALDPVEVAASAGVAIDHVSEKQLLAALTIEQRTRRNTLKLQIPEMEAELKKLKPKPHVKAFAARPRQPELMYVLRRGNVSDRGDVVSPSALSAIPGINPDFGLQPNAPDTDRRMKLAQWITDDNNPLFARVITNRLWLYHFGTGIVDTPNDFGTMGGRPSHPQLLDWLATEMIARRWSIKQMHRLILTSATYRQATTSNPQAMKVDADNRLLWRMNSRRLEAEALRDTLLAVSGELNRSVGGIGYRDVHEYRHKGAYFYDPIQPTGPEAFRRTVYRFSPRGAKKNMLDTFDCPDPSSAAPKRAVTTTPLQALSLLNNPFVLDIVNRIAERIESETKDTDAQLDRVYRLAYGRPIERDELADARAFVQAYSLAAWCRIVVNTNEFLYVK